MYVGYTNSFSVCFFCTIEFLCMQVEQNTQDLNILLTCCVDMRIGMMPKPQHMDRGRGNTIKTRVGA
jgi:hypothetical protein